jgi:hypothetical protein
MWFSLHDLLTKVVDTRTLAIVAIVVAGVNVVVSVAVLVVVAFLFGHVR